MANTNPVFNVLVTKGNQALLAAGQRPSALAVGQMGIFSRITGLSLDATANLADATEFYIAVGVNKDGGTTLQDIVTNAGDVIQRLGVQRFTGKCAVPELPQIIDITNFTATNCDTEYILKISVANQQGYINHGYNLIANSFNAKTDCCPEDCTGTDCGSANPNDLPVKLYREINAQTEKYVIAQLFDTAAPTVVIVDIDAWLADPGNANKTLGLRLVTQPVAIKKFCIVNLGYFEPRGTHIFASFVEGFDCNSATITTNQVGQFAEGLGYDLAQMEYVAGGWSNPGPYRLSNVALPRGFDSYVDQAAYYTQFHLMYKVESESGWHEYKSPLQTVIAIPCGDAATLASFQTVITPLLAGVAGVRASATAITCTCPA